MVKIAIAGGSSTVANEIIDALVATQRHEIVIFSRKVHNTPLLFWAAELIIDMIVQDIPTEKTALGITWKNTTYQDKDQLVEALDGVHTVLSFLVTQEDPASIAQKNLIDAAIQAGVKRFAPSEWAWYISLLLVLEYTLFQPGTFVNYLTHPYQSAKHVPSMELFFDFENRRAIFMDDGDNDRMSFITVQDFTKVIVQAVEFEGEWPVIGGIRGTDISIGNLIALGEKVRGGAKFQVERVKAQDLQNGTWSTSWVPRIDHPSIPREQIDAMSRIVCAGILLATHDGAYSVSDEWNRLLPSFQPTPIEKFLAESWHDKP
ncbi:NAD(P)-binding protein [Penicillium waksmanii]|uniref:NAD(P)-binding protein n=1 Tax=Penicillium waksmanii TaxID=69791 RepID=UPI002546AAD4|nr:NAD(P)-binding protein [Penicillium waksmanii]KAJ6000669.1 NAD(P)-binding protein [Penicillium waksmanii]